jgi:hypothetical protein
MKPAGISEKRREYLKDEINETAVHNNNMAIRDLYREIHLIRITNIELT